MNAISRNVKRIWQAQPGPQTILMRCPFGEIGYGGARGGGKSDGIIGKWVQHVFEVGGCARGIIFRRTYPELEQLEARAIEILEGSGWRYIQGKRTFINKDGARLKLRYLEKDRDAGNYQGHEYTFIAVDEYGEFPSPDPINKIKVCLRSAKAEFKVFVASFNPGGVGHNHIKQYFIDPAPPLTPIINSEGGKRIFIPAKLSDNIILQHKDPDYWKRIKASGIPEYLLKAWLYGEWDIVAGGFFDDLWVRNIHIIHPFDIPQGWLIDRSFDWGSSKPFSVGWWAESDGTDAEVNTPEGKIWRKFPPGSIFRIAEWYGWEHGTDGLGVPNKGLKLTNSEIAEGILEREREFGLEGRVDAGPADPSIWDCSRGPSIAQDMADAGVDWLQGENKGGSRVIRWQRIRQMLKAAKVKDLENAHIYTFPNCTDGFIRCFPVTQRDKKKVEDIDTTQEDHCQDEVGYRVMGESGTTHQSIISH